MASDRHWRLHVLAFWLAAAALLIWARWQQIRWFGLVDTDDNLRIMQVRALLAGQDWFDLRQYRLAPPHGANVHWSRLVDLPIAGLVIALKPLLGGAAAERWAVAIAPMLPMAAALLAVAALARRLVAPLAYPLACALLLCAHSARAMWGPTRIDHHGWQLACLAVVALGLTDPNRRRGGVLLGLATATSLAIGLENLIYLAVAGAAAGLLWIFDAAEHPRLRSYGVALGGGCALGFALFASQANRLPVCDAFSPVWLSAMLGFSALAVLLTALPLASWRARLIAAALGACVVATAVALAWPHCLGRLEGVSPELDRLWLSRVREARPIYTHAWLTIASSSALPVSGLVGYALVLWRARSDRAALERWLPLAALGLVSAALLLWQTRAGPSAQLLAVPGATALAWALVQAAGRLRDTFLQAGAMVAAFCLVAGLAAQGAAELIPANKSKGASRVSRANQTCPTLAALRPIAQQPRGRVLTFVDLGPRLVAVTHHDAVAGPYHRNQAAILDVMRAFRGSDEAARRTIARRGIDYVLICAGMGESTIYAAEAKNGFYAHLAAGRAPDWLAPVPLPRSSPYRMWRVVRR